MKKTNRNALIIVAIFTGIAVSIAQPQSATIGFKGVKTTAYKYISVDKPKTTVRTSSSSSYSSSSSRSSSYSYSGGGSSYGK